MKSILLFQFIFMVSPLSAIEPGRYLISCQDVDKRPFRGYLLTVPKVGDPVLEAAGFELGVPPSARTESVKINESENYKGFSIVAVFTEYLKGTGSAKPAVATFSLSLSFDEEGEGGGAEVSIGEPHGGGPLAKQRYLKAFVSKLPDAEQAAPSNGDKLPN